MRRFALLWYIFCNRQRRAACWIALESEEGEASHRLMTWLSSLDTTWVTAYTSPAHVLRLLGIVHRSLKRKLVEVAFHRNRKSPHGSRLDHTNVVIVHTKGLQEGSTCTTIRELGPIIPSLNPKPYVQYGILGPNSLIVVYMDPQGHTATFKASSAMCSLFDVVAGWGLCRDNGKENGNYYNRSYKVIFI